jgi:hypothetical protein
MIGDGVGLADRKGIPVDDGVLGPLIDVEAIVRGRSDCRMARGDRAALRQNAGASRQRRLNRSEPQRGSGGKRDRAAQKTPRRTRGGDRGSRQIFSSKMRENFLELASMTLIIFGFGTASTRHLFIWNKKKQNLHCNPGSDQSEETMQCRGLQGHNPSSGVALRLLATRRMSVNKPTRLQNYRI